MSQARDIPILDKRGLAKNRIEALADGIFAVAMTLLVLDIKSPVNREFETAADLVNYLVALEHSFAMYAISFFVLAIFWISHHLLFHFVRHVDRRLLWLNVGFLLLVTFVPFSTDLLGDHGHLMFHFVRHVDRRLLWLNVAFLLLVTFVPFSTDLLGDHGHLMLPVLIYGANLLALGLLLAIQLRYLVAHRELATADLTDAVVAQIWRGLKLYASIPVASMAVSLASPRTGMYMYLLLAIPTFAPSRLDRLLHPGAAARADTSGEDS